MDQTCKNDKDLVSGQSLIPLAQILFPKNSFVNFTSTRCYKLLKTIIVCNFNENYSTRLEKMAKNLVLDPVLAPLAQILDLYFFSVDFTSTRG